MVYSAEDLMQSHFIAVGRTKRVGPGSVVETVRVHNESVPVPPAYRISVIRRLGTIERFSAVRPNVAKGMAPLEKFHDFIGSLNEPHQRRKNLQHYAGVSRGLALEHRVVPFFFRGDGGSNSRRFAVS